MAELLETKPPSKKIGIVEDNPVSRLSIQSLVQKQQNVAVVGSWESAERFWADPKRTEVEMLLVDLELPRLEGVELVTRMRNEHPSVICIMLTSSSEPRHVLPLMQRGVSGYLIKQSHLEDLLLKLDGERYEGLTLSPEVARLLADQCFQTHAALGSAKKRIQAFNQLTQREEVVLNTLAKNGSAKGAALQLGLSHETIRAHLKKIYRKLGVHSKAEAVARLAQSLI
jgi:two-component system nitrate/nitrite response regulator NarL